MSTALAASEPGLHGALFLRMGLLIDLRRSLRELEREYAADVERLREFERRYRPAVGDRYDELERLRERINREWEAVENAGGGGSNGRKQEPEGAGGAAPSEFAGARKLFLALAREIHPDLATDEDERQRRHEVMAEATLAYRNRDERRLQWLTEHWRAESAPIDEYGLGSLWLKTNRQIAWVRYRIREMQHSIGQLHASPMARLMEESERARGRGRNLVLELRNQVQAELEEAYRELDRARSAIRDLGSPES